jgi:tetratricopeptide (TPR) repeat protein
VSPGRTILGEPDQLTVDFLSPEELRGQRSRVIDEATVVAMYFNNLAAEALTINHVDEAYWYIRASIDTDPRWMAAYNTLAVLYKRKGMGAEAEAALRHVLVREPLNSQALSNMVLVLSEAGRQPEAEVYAEQLAQVQPIAPYKFFDQGLDAMRKADYATAREYFRKELARAAYVPEFHFWLALADYGLGDVSGAKGEIAKALENSTTSKDKQIYSAKLAWLNEQSKPRR